MSGDRLALILARQKQTHDQRMAASEEKRRQELAKEKRVQELLETWTATQRSLRAIIAELNGAMQDNGVILEYREETTLAGARYSAIISYSQPQEYISTGLFLRLYSNQRGLLTISIMGVGRPIKNDKIKLIDFEKEVQRTWLLDFLEVTADAEAGQK